MSNPIALIGQTSDPLFTWWQNQLAQIGIDYRALHINDPSFSALESAEVVFNTCWQNPGQAMIAYLRTCQVQGVDWPKTIIQNVLTESLFQSKLLWDKTFGISLNMDLVGYSAFSLYPFLFSDVPADILPAIETTCLPTQSITQEAEVFFSRLELKTIECPPCPSLILGRIVAMLTNEACSALMEGVAISSDIDTAMTLGTNYPLGPLAWADAAGLDVILAILNHLLAVYQESRYRPVRLLQERVALGQLGRHSGNGFFNAASMGVTT